jgi:putative ABC transport system permease protein
MRERFVRWTGLVGVALRRTATKATRTAPRQTAVSVAGVAVAVALMLVVTATGLGLVEGTTVRGEAVDYWVVPESSGMSTLVVSADAPKLGDVHAKSADLTDDGRVDYATPVLVEVVEVRAGGSAEYVLAVGVIPSPEFDGIAGLSAGPLTPGDPHYADGAYDGDWTGEAVFSEGAADRLGVDTGASVSVSGAFSGSEARDLRAVDVQSAAVESGLSGVPVMVVHLSELQTITGAESGDQADQILVESTAGGLESELDERYEGATAVTRAGFAARQTTDSELPLAMGLAALLIAVVVGALFVATTQGLQVEADSEQLAALNAIGFSRGARATVLVVQALALTLVGGALGVVVAYGATAVVNFAAIRAIAPVPIADFHPLLVAYGLGVSALIGLLVAPYLLAMEARIDNVTEVIR